MRESQLRELIKEEIRSKSNSKSNLNESTNITDINKASGAVSELFESGKVKMIIRNIFETGISEVLRNTEKEHQLYKYEGYLLDLEAELKTSIRFLKGRIKDIEDSFNGEDEEYEEDDY